MQSRRAVARRRQPRARRRFPLLNHLRDAVPRHRRAHRAARSQASARGAAPARSRRAVARRRQPRARRRRDSSTRSWRLASTAPSHPSTTSQSPRAVSLSKHAVADAKESPSFRRSSAQIRPSTFRGDSLKRIVTRSAGGRPSRAIAGRATLRLHKCARPAIAYSARRVDGAMCVASQRPFAHA